MKYKTLAVVAVSTVLLIPVTTVTYCKDSCPVTSQPAPVTKPAPKPTPTPTP